MVMTETKYQLVSFPITAVHCEDATDVYEDEPPPMPHGDGDGDRRKVKASKMMVMMKTTCSKMMMVKMVRKMLTITMRTTCPVSPPMVPHSHSVLVRAIMILFNIC